MVNTAATQNLGLSTTRFSGCGHCCILSKSKRLQQNIILTPQFNVWFYCKSVKHTKCTLVKCIKNMVQLLFFYTALEKKYSGKKTRIKQTLCNPNTFIQSPIHPPMTKDIKSMTMCCHFSLHSWLYIEGYAAVMTLRDGVVFWVSHCVILRGARKVRSAAVCSQLRGFYKQCCCCHWADTRKRGDQSVSKKQK